VECCSALLKAQKAMVPRFLRMEIGSGGLLMSVKRRSSNPRAEGAPLWPPRNPIRRKTPITSQHPPLAGLRLFPPNFPATDKGPLVQNISDRYGFGWRIEPIAAMGRFLKRIMDVSVSTLALLFLWPLMLLIAIAIKLESHGPAIYRSLRLGKDGCEFDCFKFRTMIAGSDGLKENLRRLNQRRGPFFKIADDPRVTPLGRFLRKYSLDELPQLWNVLKGDMSLVGPRPHPVEDCARYSSEDCRRLDVKPGVTGLWQVMARANPSFEICMMLDLAYIEKWSFFLDCRILLKTIPAVLAGEGQ
jgi:lipopolysaccharide/colanic/teichoic acid biosynthesis glycosyltransferase